ncbi:hypothetical protein J14TS2_06360 [Bacillus sp. J14TS2]|nr:hypothetical protein J14TS2_06360 [Bacillus sp. J14TS2]
MLNRVLIENSTISILLLFHKNATILFGILFLPNLATKSKIYFLKKTFTRIKRKKPLIVKLS